MKHLNSYLTALMSLMFLCVTLTSWFFTLSLMCTNTSYLLFFPISLGEWEPWIMSLSFDYVSTTFLGSVSFISSMVFMFSAFYMSEEKYKSRFSLILFLFVLSMFMLIIMGDVIFLIIGWDLLGVTSFLLVLYFNNKKSLSAAMLTAMTNRVGDVGIIISISLMTKELSALLMEFKFESSMISSALLFLVLSSLTKSAQVPFSSWLPAAMAAPTPVSALVHSSTLVTAGVYLMIRVGGCGETWINSYVLILLGMLTLTTSSLTAIFEMDLKKIIALSTLSQLGFMFLMLGAGQTLAAFFHMNTHAFFKSLLFIGAGDLIHSTHGWQDIRKSSFFSKKEPFLATVILWSNLSLMGLPFLSGFYSKDFFLEVMSSSEYSFSILFLAYLSVGMTSIYSVRFLTILIFKNTKSNVMVVTKNLSWVELYSFPLFIFAVMAGGGMSWLLFPSFMPIFLPSLNKTAPIFIILMSLYIYLFSFMQKFSPRNFFLMPYLNILNLSMLAGGVPLLGTKKFSLALSKFSEKTIFPIMKFVKISMVGVGRLSSSSGGLKIYLFTIFVLALWGLM